jgi:hypothetical protein
MAVVPREMYCNCGKASLPRKPKTANSQKTQEAKDFFVSFNLPKPPNLYLTCNLLYLNLHKIHPSQIKQIKAAP